MLCFKNKKFRIMLVGDPHEKELNGYSEDTGINKYKDYIHFQTKAAKTLKPDLIILMGDNASASSPENLRKTLLGLTAPYADEKIPFTFILGNHDLETAVDDLDTQYSIYKSLPFIEFPEEYTKKGDYVIPVLSTDKSKSVLNLWHIFNGRHPAPKYLSHYSAVDEEQISWFEQTSANLKQNNPDAYSIVFQHVPVDEEFFLLNQKGASVMLTDGVQGLNGKVGKYFNLKKTTKGYMGEAPCSADYNKGQFASWRADGKVIAAFFGHDHMNDFIGKVQGITLAQCKTASFRAYGDGLMQGVRIIDFDEENPTEFKTEMVYYRDIIGDECYSIHGTEKALRDRTSVKLDVLMKASKYVIPLSLTAILIKSARK